MPTPWVAKTVAGSLDESSVAETHVPSPAQVAAVVGVCLGLWWLRVWWAQGDHIDRYVNFDALAYWAPLLRETAAQWRAGILPLWNPYQALGTPLLATLQVGAAYPLNALYLVLGVGWAWLLTGVLHHVIAACGMYGFCRSLDLSRTGSMVGALIFGFCGLVAAKYLDQPEFICLAWLPVLFLAAERLLLRPSLNTIAALAVVWALQILGGHPETIVHSGLLLAAYVGMRLCTLAAKAPRRALAAALGSVTAAAAALALSAFQWLPTLELLPHSVRAVGALSLMQQALVSMPPLHLATGPAGRMPLALGLVGFWTWRRRGLAWFFAGAAVALIVLSTGPATPLFALFRHLPTGAWFRAPVRFLNLLPLCVATLGAAAVDGLWLRPSPGSPKRVAVASVLILLAARLAFTHRTEWVILLLITLVFDFAPVLAITAVGRDCAKQAGSDSLYRLASIGAIAVVCAAPGFYLQRYASPLQLEGMYGPYRTLFGELQRQSSARVLSLLPFADGSAWAKLGTYFEVPVLNDVEPLSLVDFRAFSDLLRGGGPSGREASVGVFMGETAPPYDHFDSRMLNMSGVRFVVADSSTEPRLEKWFGPGVQLVPWRRWRSVVVYENRSALPRAFFLSRGRAQPAAGNCTDSLRAAQFDPSKTVILEQPIPGGPVDTTHEQGDVSVIEYRPDRVRLSVESEEPGFVILADAYYPGWTAKVDGNPVPVLRADCFLRAISVAAGQHRVEFQYVSRPFRIGSVFSLLTLAAMTAGGLVPWRCFRRNGSNGNADVPGLRQSRSRR